MSYQKITKHVVVPNTDFQRKSEELAPQLFSEKVIPAKIVKTIKDKNTIHGWKVVELGAFTALRQKEFGKGESFCLDFGQHVVGYLSLNIKPTGSPPDAPLHIRLTFGEMPIEVSEPFSSYDGWISSSWLQEITLHVDVLPNVIHLPRRYSFRYVKVEILDTSKKYNVSFDEIYCTTVTSADVKDLEVYNHSDEDLRKIDEVSIKTLQDCMQEVFEDGPKRDRRLWLGDLRLQALANYETFKNNNLVKRNLYQFAAVPNQIGEVSANLFIAPSLIPDDTFLYDYSLFFTVTLYDYYMASNDLETLEELWDVGYRQVEIGLERVDESGLVEDDSSWWAFIDWNSELNKQTSAQAVLIYTLRRSIELANILGKYEQKAYLIASLVEITKASITYLWDEEEGLFISGNDRQISWASQVWMVLSEVFDNEKNREILQRLIKTNPDVKMNTPYMHHHLVEALLLVGEKKKAVDYLKQYWGGMIKEGADTFWELYNPADKTYSPYGNNLINSYCHAWSCTPTYLIRKFEL
ncbi:alpha-L-rhamnosidase-related protein [Bacillus solitudinis]|uniref:alpha-L-rhamnosidase-related protein n=1 Tax=Bacillus solitudinis TaxID=2014074 RepID=UPI000C2454BB|nr:family 78 glycoside hydrolase catalytic domain [Bacillus solitudinis]